MHLLGSPTTHWILDIGYRAFKFDGSHRCIEPLALTLQTVRTCISAHLGVNEPLARQATNLTGTTFGRGTGSVSTIPRARWGVACQLGGNTERLSVRK